MRLSCKGSQCHSTSTAWQDASKKNWGSTPQAVIVLTELMSLAQAKREMGIVKSKHVPKGKEWKGKLP